MILLIHFFQQVSHKVCHHRWSLGSRGAISAGTLTISLLLVVLTLGLFYHLLFSPYTNPLSAYDDKIVKIKSETVPTRFTIKNSLASAAFRDVTEETNVDTKTPSQPFNDHSPERRLTKNPDSKYEWTDKDWSPTIAESELDGDFVKGDDDALTKVEKPTAQSTNFYVRVPVGRVRDMASETGRVKTRLFKGERINVLAEDGNWFKISTADGRNGWAHRKLFSKKILKDPDKDNSSYIKGIHIENLTKEGSDVLIELDAYGLPETMMIKGERPRLVCDFYGFLPGLNMAKQMNLDNGPIRSIRLGYHHGEQAKTRVVIDLLPEYKYIIDKKFIIEKNTYCIHIRL